MAMIDSLDPAPAPQPSPEPGLFSGAGTGVGAFKGSRQPGTAMTAPAG